MVFPWFSHGSASHQRAIPMAHRRPAAGSAAAARRSRSNDGCASPAFHPPGHFSPAVIWDYTFYMKIYG